MVIGGSGYIASWLIKELLIRGCTVKASVCYPDSKSVFGSCQGDADFEARFDGELGLRELADE
ncbi:hypothetical protein CASFOL_027021 [Castilleja foliolosa]|uniref:NAD-dependent epimerase/dehydratase domain-containing protein n=1 Tax=Castilleja foliolosa TaxID=1961234 RepID=A0ABD3CKK0_9LAMI